MALKTERRDGVLIVRADGPIDGGNAADFEKTIREARDDNRGLLVDCGKLTFIGGVGLRLVLMIAKKLTQRDAGFALCAMSEPIQEVFHTTGFGRIVEVHSTEAEALASLEGPWPGTTGRKSSAGRAFGKDRRQRSHSGRPAARACDPRRLGVARSRRVRGGRSRRATGQSAGFSIEFTGRGARSAPLHGHVLEMRYAQAVFRGPVRPH